MGNTITVAIPLHASAKWVDNVVSNVRRLTAIVTEVLISDQTCLDDAAEQIRSLLFDDPRVKIYADPRGMQFHEHYQFLLEQASGTYFMWMPHDDIYEPSWVPTLAKALDQHPEVWLAYGQLKYMQMDERTIIFNSPFAFKSGTLSLITSIRLLISRRSAIAFKGLFRREKVLLAGIKMDPATSLVPIDIEWVFTVALHGKLFLDKSTTILKLLHPDNTFKTKAWKSQRRGNELQAAIALLKKYGPKGINGMILRLYVIRLYGTTRLYVKVINMVPGTIKLHLKTFAEWVLSKKEEQIKH
jgi:GT2 family glycosyltransferase